MSTPARPARPARGPTPADERLRRLLAMLPWLASRGRVPIDEMAAHFGLRRDQLVRDLELASCCGVPPYTADELLDVIVDDDTVELGVARFFTRPLRLTPREGFALLAAGRAALEVTGADDGALASALDKLERALGGREQVTVEVDQPPALDTVRRAIAEGVALDVVYYSAWRDSLGERRVHPHAVYVQDGHWYLLADCELAGAERRFRVDRIEHAVLTTVPARRREVAVPVDGPPAVVDDADTTEVVLDLPASARWVSDTYPGAVIEAESADRLRVVLPVWGERWLELLLLRVGPEAKVERPAEWRGAGVAAAARLLDRYRSRA
jgi:proteasome accessory factor C